MLSRPSPIGFAGRAAAALLTIVFCALAFAPVRFVQAHEPTPGERFLAANERVPIAYLIKARGMKGTRGSGNTEDLASAHRLERLDADAVYFRLGERRWIATDPRTLAEVHEAVEPERRFEERQLVVSGRRDGLEAERLKLERRHEDLVAGKDRLEQIRRALQERIDAARETDGSARGLAAERDAIEEARIELWAAEQELHKARSMLARRMKSLHEEDRLDHAERERVHRRILERVAEICRAAVADGRAGEFVP